MNKPLIKFFLLGFASIISSVIFIILATNNNFEWWGLFGGLSINAPLVYLMKIIKEDNRLFAKSFHKNHTQNYRGSIK